MFFGIFWCELVVFGCDVFVVVVFCGGIIIGCFGIREDCLLGIVRCDGGLVGLVGFVVFFVFLVLFFELEFFLLKSCFGLVNVFLKFFFLVEEFILGFEFFFCCL